MKRLPLRKVLGFCLRALMLAGLGLSSLTFAQSGPSTLNISGGLFNPNGTPVTNSSVNFKLEVRDKDGTCVLYSETHTAQDLSASKGGFALKIGDGTAKTNNIDGSSATALSTKVFANPGAVSPFPGCGAGLTLASGDERVIRVYYDLGSGYTAMSPDVPITSAAYAMVAETLEGKHAADLIQVRDDATYDLNQANVESIFSAANFAKLTALLTGSASNQRLTNVVDPTAASDAATKGYADGNVGGKVGDFTGVGPATGDGKTLIWDQAQNKWITGTPSAVDASKLPLAGGTMTGAIAMGGQNITNIGHMTMATQKTLNLGTYTDAQEATLIATPLTAADKGKVWFNTTSNTFKVWDGTAAVNSFAPSGTAGGDLTGTYPNPTIANGKVLTAAIANDAVTSAKINNTGIAVNRLLITDATTGGTVGYSVCAVGEVLKYGATGWACSTVASLLGNSGVTAATYGTATDVAQVQVDAQGRVTSAANVAITFPVVSVAGKTGAVTLNTGDLTNAGTAATKDFGAAAGNLVELDAGAKIPVGLLPSSVGDIQDVVAGSGLTGGGSSGAVTLSVDTGITTGKIVQMAASDKLPAVDGSNLTQINAVKLQARDVAASAPNADEVLTWNNATTAWEPRALPAGNVGDMTAVVASTGLTGGGISGDVTISVDVGTVTGKIVQMAASDKLPAVDGSNLTNINAVQLQSKNVSATPPTANQVLKWNNGTSLWEPAAETDAFTGTVTSVVSGAGLVAGNITSTGTINIDVGVTTGKIVQMAASDKLPAVDGSNLTQINAVKLQARDVAATAPGANEVLMWNNSTSVWEPKAVPSAPVSSVATKTGAVTLDWSDILNAAGKYFGYKPNNVACGAGEVLKWNNGASYWECGTDLDSGGDIQSVTAGTGATGGGVTGAVTIGVDVGTVTGKIVQMAASDKLPAVDGSNLTNINAVQIQGKNISATAPTANQVLKWNNGTSVWEAAAEVDAYSGTVTSVVSGTGLVAGNITNAGTLNIDVGTTTGKIVQMAASDKLPAVDGSNLTNLNLSASNGFVQNGNSFGGAATLGTNDNFALNFEANNATAMTILPSGYVGIGTAAPAVPLHVTTSAASTNTVLEVGRLERLTSGTSATGLGGSLNFYNQNALGTSIATSSITSKYITGGNTLTFSTNTAGTLTEYMRIDSFGNVGIGTTNAVSTLDVVNPTSQIHVGQGGDIGGYLLSTAASQAVLAGGVNWNGSNWVAKATTASYINQNTGTIGFFTDSGLTAGNTYTPTRRMHITAAGDVGIGTTNPASKLDVIGTITATGFSGPLSTSVGTFGLGTVGAPSITFTGDTDTGWWSPSADTIAASTAGTERIRIGSTGNVGIGTTNAAAKLDVTGTSDLVQLAVRGFTGQTSDVFQLYDPGGTKRVSLSNAGDLLLPGGASILASNGYLYNSRLSAATNVNALVWPSSTGTQITRDVADANSALTVKHINAGATGAVLDLQNSSASVMKVLTSGNVGIGTGAPSQKLDVFGTDANVQMQVMNSDSTVARYPGYRAMNFMGAANAGYPSYQIYNFRGTAGASSAVQSGDWLGAFSVVGGTGAAWASGGGASISVVAGETFSSTVGGSHLLFNTASIGTNATTEKMRITANGNVGIGSTVPGSKLDVVGQIRATNAAGSAVWIDGAAGTTRGLGFGTNLSARWRVQAGSGAEGGANAGSDFNIQNFDDSGTLLGAPITILRSNGNVGIGSTVPASKLDVNGTVTATGFSGPVSTSVGTFGLGTVGAPSLTFTGDTNTGWWSPAADTLAASTNGTERVRIDSSGNLGIGTTNPTNLLTVYGSNAPSFERNDDNNTNVNGLRMLRSRSSATAPGADFGSNISFLLEGFTDGSAVNAVQVTGAWETAQTNNTTDRDSYLTFSTMADNTASEKMRITSAGFVGIGTIAASNRLVIGDDSLGALSNPGNSIAIGSASSTSVLSLGQSPTARGQVSWAYNATPANAYLTVTSSSNPVVLQQSGGNVGVGTTNPAGLLDIKGSSDQAQLVVRSNASQGNYLAEFKNTTGVTGLAIWANGTIDRPAAAAADMVIQTSGNYSVTTRTNGTERMRVTGAGDVGIGTTNPASKLDVIGTITATSFAGPVTSSVVSAGAGTVGAPSLSFSGDANTGFYNASSNDTISVAINAIKTFDFTSAGLASPTTGGGLITTGNGTVGAPTFSFTGDAGTGWWRPAANSMAASTNSVERVRITNSGVGIGTGSPAELLEVRSTTSGAKIKVRGDGGVSTTRAELVLDRTSQARGAGMRIQGSTDAPAEWWAGVPYNGGSTADVFSIGRHATAPEQIANSFLLVNSSGNVGIGTTNPAQKVDILTSSTATSGTVMGIQNAMSINAASASSGSFYGSVDSTLVSGSQNYTGFIFASEGFSTHSGSGTVNSMFGADYYTNNTSATGTITTAIGVQAHANNSSTGTISGATGVNAYAYNASTGSIGTAQGIYATIYNNSTGTITNAFAGRFGFPINNGTITNAYGVYIDDVLGTNQYGIFQSGSNDTNYFAGNVGVGTASPSSRFEIGSSGDFTMKAGSGSPNDPGDFIFRDNSGVEKARIYSNPSAGGGLRLSGHATTPNIDVIIDSSGNVGIGTPTPQSQLHITGDMSMEYGKASLGNLYWNGSWKYLGNGSGGYVKLADTAIDGISFVTAPANASGPGAAATPVTRMVVLGSNGNVGIGTTAPTHILHITGQGRSTNSAWATTSDIRLKDVHGVYERGIEDIMKLPLIRYNYKKDNIYGLPSEKEFVGTIAQDAQKAIPESVTVDSNGFLVLNTDPIFWAMVGAQKELYGMCEMSREQLMSLNARVDQHDRDIASLKQENADLKEQNAALKEAVCEINPNAKICK